MKTIPEYYRSINFRDRSLGYTGENWSPMPKALFGYELELLELGRRSRNSLQLEDGWGEFEIESRCEAAGYEVDTDISPW